MAKNTTFEQVIKKKPKPVWYPGSPENVTQELKEFNEGHCAAGIKKNGNSCFTKEQLVRIATAYNADNPKNKIKFNTRTTANELWNLIRKQLSNVCQNEWCWLDQNFAKGLRGNTSSTGRSGGGTNLDKRFKPRGTKSRTGWLSTTDIDEVMQMYEKIHDNFTFFGPVPIDFKVINTELNDLNIEQLDRKHIYRIGIIFNLDPHDQDGSHWVAMYVDTYHKQIYFFDSYGSCPAPKEIMDLMVSLANKIRKLRGTRKIDMRCNTTRMQYANTECGVYSMYFILELLKGRSFDDVTKNIISDEEINKFRDVYFRSKK